MLFPFAGPRATLDRSLAIFEVLVHAFHGRRRKAMHFAMTDAERKAQTRHFDNTAAATPFWQKGPSVQSQNTLSTINGETIYHFFALLGTAL